MPPVPAPVIIGVGLLAALAAGYIIYKASQASSHAHAQEAATHETLPDGGAPQILSE